MGYRNHSMHFLGIVGYSLAVVAGWEFYKWAVIPLQDEEPEVLRDVAELSGRIGSANEQIARIAAQKEAAGNAASPLEGGQAGLSGALKLASVPSLVSGHFSGFGLGAPTVVRKEREDDPDIYGYERSSWLVSVPIDKEDPKLAPLLRATASLDPQGSFLSVRNFTIWPDPEDSTRRRATIQVSVLSKKEETGR